MAAQFRAEVADRVACIGQDADLKVKDVPQVSNTR